jgi:hypothetical protein
MYDSVNRFEGIFFQEWDGYKNIQLQFLLVITNRLPVKAVYL